MLSLNGLVAGLQLSVAFITVLLPVVVLLIPDYPNKKKRKLSFPFMVFPYRTGHLIIDTDLIPDTLSHIENQEILLNGSHPINFDSIPLKESAVNQQDKNRIELKAMSLVRQYEELNGRLLEDVSMYYIGYDFKSYDNYTNEPNKFRAIEVKGKRKAGKINITTNEWKTAQAMGNNYFLYIVEDVFSDRPRLKIIQNPFASLKAQVNQTQFLLPRRIYCQAKKVTIFEKK